MTTTAKTANDSEDARDRRAARRIAYMDAGGRLLLAGYPAVRTVVCCATVLLGAQSFPWIR